MSKTQKTSESLSEIKSDTWDGLYCKNRTPWQSNGDVEESLRLLRSYNTGSHLLDVGCGTGEDAIAFAKRGFHVSAIDHSKQAVAAAKHNSESSGLNITYYNDDISEWAPAHLFDIVYDKGVFHNLSGPKKRRLFAEKISSLLDENGIWINVSGCADHCNSDNRHGAILLRDIINTVEIYFEVLEIKKLKYGTLDATREFDAWYCAFKRR